VINFKTLDNLKELGISGKKVLLRADLNVPIKHGKVSETSRIKGILPTLKELVKENAKIVIISHFGRPGGKYDSNYSLSPIVDNVAEELSSFLGKEISIKFGVDCVGTSAKNAVSELQDGEIIILENLRFHEGEKSNDSDFVNALAELADFYVNDAFSCCHREHASIYGITKKLPSFAGRLLEKEISSLNTALEAPQRPLVAIVGGSKISTKIQVLNSLVTKADYLFIGGGMANTFLYAKGVDIGKSLCEKDLKSEALKIIENASKHNCEIVLPIDAACSDSIENGSNCDIADISNISQDQMILDAATGSIINWSSILDKCKTVLWNGPLGAFEYSPFDNSSIALARQVSYLTSHKNLNSVAGGGDTVALLDKAGVKNKFSYISTAGGAFLEWLEGKGLPGIIALKK
jgi:phosphoglycerate kinase